MQLRILLCALVVLTAYATPIVAPNPKSVKLISKDNNEETLKDNLEVIRLKRAANSMEETDVPRLEDFQRLIKVFEKFFNSERLTNAKNTSVIKFLMQFLKLVENYMNSNNNIDNSSE